MCVSRQVFLAAAILTSMALATGAACAQPDEATAERILGPHWKQLSRHAGMVFAGTVLSDAAPTVRQDLPVPSVELRLKVDRAIAGVDSGEVLIIHEWIGAWSSQRAMHPGQHFLFFLYPPSRLGLTSAIGGWQGQIPLDASGNFIESNSLRSANGVPIESPPNQKTHQNSLNLKLSLQQLERVIRAARGE